MNQSEESLDHAIDSIKTREDEKQYEVPAYKETLVEIPFSYLKDYKSQRDTLLRLIRYETPLINIKALVQKAKSDGNWLE